MPDWMDGKTYIVNVVQHTINDTEMAFEGLLSYLYESYSDLFRLFRVAIKCTETAFQGRGE